MERQLLLPLETNISMKTDAKDKIPHIIKYMGSKKPIIDFIISSISKIHSPENFVCDLFAGSCSISAALRKKYKFISNDIQDYSRIIANMYFSDLSSYSYEEINEQIDISANIHVLWFKENYGSFFYDYNKITDLTYYQEIEKRQRDIFTGSEINIDYHLFTKYYSGTYWSFEQCVWIDALRKVADNFIGTPVYYSIISSIMYAMSYTTQSTGHFAQYRDGNSVEAMNNIVYYRQKSIYELFTKKIKELLNTLDNHLTELITTTLSFTECLQQLPEGTTIYADPPYAPVHYSRFYHALETIVKYDYPKITHKGRYRDDRHQSPFSQKGKALSAFNALFDGVKQIKGQLILSYSGSGVLKITEIIALAKESFKAPHYKLEVKTLDHKHSTMGRFEDADRDVVEYLIIAKLNQNA